MRSQLPTALAALLLAGAALAAPADELKTLIDAEWERLLRESPETASYFGDKRYDDRWSEATLEAFERRHAGNEAVLQRLAAIERSALPPADQLNYDLFKRDYQMAVEGYRFRDFLMPVSPINWSGFGHAVALAQLPMFTTAADYENWIKRLQAYGTLIDQHIVLMRQGMMERRVPPRIVMERLPRQIASQLAPPPEHPLYAPFRSFPAGIDPETRRALEQQAQAALRETVIPAFTRFLGFLEKEYLPACSSSIAASALPDGAAYYAFQVRQSTTTDLSPERIHEIGLAEVSRIRGEMEKIKRQANFDGTLHQFFRFLREDPQFYYAKGEDLFNAYLVLSRRIDPELVRLFGVIPRMPYGIKPVPEASAPDSTTAYYQSPAEDGSRAGYYFVNLYKPETRPKWEMEALSLHESVPGHHLQMARAQELGELPKFRRLGGYTAFVEGWALYAESLGGELGLYADPYSKFGQLTYEMWRAVRLVVDTGIHAKGWSRQQAIDFFKDNAAKTENDITVEVDRYISWPGQALAYKMGELKIKELRARATQRLGAKFDVRAFHDVVLGSGALPLDVLERQVDRWIEQRLKAA